MPNASAAVVVDNGIGYLFDPIRDKTLSFTRGYLRAGRKHPNVTNQSLRVEDGQPTVLVGDSMIHNGTITGLSANCAANATWTLEILKKGSPTVLASLSLVSQQEKRETGLNVDFSEGDVLLFRMAGTSVPFPRGMLEIAWRLP